MLLLFCYDPDMPRPDDVAGGTWSNERNVNGVRSMTIFITKRLPTNIILFTSAAISSESNIARRERRAIMLIQMSMIEQEP